MTERRGPDGNTAARILDSAERLVQSRGFNGFSYADVAAELGITKASLHYHFAGKAELGRALVERYAARFAAQLEDIDTGGDDAPAKLDAYARIYTDALSAQRMCLCGMLAADYETIPDPMREAVIAFFDHNETWLARILEQGRSDGLLHLDGRPRDLAQAIISSLEGAMLVARPYGDVARFQATASRLLATLAPRHPRYSNSTSG